MITRDTVKKNFDIEEYLMDYSENGKKLYLQVDARLHWFEIENQKYSIKIIDKIIDLERCAAYFELEVATEERTVQGIGYCDMREFSSYIHTARTRALGDALSKLGYGPVSAIAVAERSYKDNCFFEDVDDNNEIKTSVNEQNQKEKTNSNFVGTVKVLTRAVKDKYYPNSVSMKVSINNQAIWLSIDDSKYTQEIKASDELEIEATEVETGFYINSEKGLYTVLSKKNESAKTAATPLKESKDQPVESEQIELKKEENKESEEVVKVKEEVVEKIQLTLDFENTFNNDDVRCVSVISTETTKDTWVASKIDILNKRKDIKELLNNKNGTLTVDFENVSKREADQMFILLKEDSKFSIVPDISEEESEGTGKAEGNTGCSTSLTDEKKHDSESKEVDQIEGVFGIYSEPEMIDGDCWQVIVNPDVNSDNILLLDEYDTLKVRACGDFAKILSGLKPNTQIKVSGGAEKENADLVIRLHDESDNLVLLTDELSI